MTRTPVPPRGGAAGVWLLLCSVAAAAGVAFDILLSRGSAFWVAAQPGGAAALGAVAAVFAVAAARLARWMLARAQRGEGEERRDAADHA